MDSYKIEKGIPYHRTLPSTKYPFNDMEIGDSFFIAKERGKSLNTTRASVMTASKTAQFLEFTTRMYASKILVEEGGVRVWRIK